MTSVTGDLIDKIVAQSTIAATATTAAADKKSRDLSYLNSMTGSLTLYDNGITLNDEDKERITNAIFITGAKIETLALDNNTYSITGILDKGSRYNQPDAESLAAFKKLIDQPRPAGSCLYFLSFGMPR